MKRRSFLSAVGGVASACRAARQTSLDVPLVKARNLNHGDTVMLINPAGATFSPSDADEATRQLEGLGLKVRRAPHLLDRRGYLAGSDASRAADINAAFSNSEVDALVCLRGGWGCARILPLIDYELIRANRKILLGFSDITALHMAIQSRAGLVTFHGPVGSSTWTRFTVEHLRSILFEGRAPLLVHGVSPSGLDLRDRYPTRLVRSGQARGRLLGGNLTVLSAIVGSGYLPDWRDAILFLEDVGEDVYRIDRMLTQLKLAGILRQINGFIFGQCIDCKAGSAGHDSLTLDELLEDHIVPLGIPAWRGAIIGHMDDQLTLPQGVQVEVDASSTTIRLLEPGVEVT